MGCGVEANKGQCDTPGFKNRNLARIIHDPRGFQKLELPRKRLQRKDNVIQTSLWQILSWRANCDVQPILYDSDPNCPDFKEIARVTDYVVAYACKGVETFLQEKATISSLVRSSKEITGCHRDVKRVARQVLNKLSGDRLISKQEASVQATGMALYECSETIERHSISGYMKITDRYVISYVTISTKRFDSLTSKVSESGMNENHILKVYARRDKKYSEMSLWDYFVHVFRNGRNNRGRLTIPHFQGGNAQPSFPPSEQYV